MLLNYRYRLKRRAKRWNRMTSSLTLIMVWLLNFDGGGKTDELYMGYTLKDNLMKTNSSLFGLSTECSIKWNWKQPDELNFFFILSWNDDRRIYKSVGNYLTEKWGLSCFTLVPIILRRKSVLSQPHNNWLILQTFNKVLATTLQVEVIVICFLQTIFSVFWYNFTEL